MCKVDPNVELNKIVLKIVAFKFLMETYVHNLSIYSS